MINKEYLRLYFKSEKGVLKRLYHHMKERSIKNNWNFEIEFNSFSDWAYNNNFKKLYDNFILKNDKKLKPSVDRINDYGFYTFDNIQLITYFENWKKGQTCIKNKKAYEKTFNLYRKKREIKVKVINNKTKFNKIFNNYNEILKYFPFMSRSKISSCVNKKRNHHFGFTFIKINGGGCVND